MNRESEGDDLLNDVLSDKEESGFEAWLLDSTLVHVRRRRTFKRNMSILGAVSCVAAIGLTVFLALRPTPVHIPAPSETYTLVSSHPLAASDVVSTHRLNSDFVVETQPSCTVVVGTHDGVRAMKDSELLQLIYPGRALLVKSQYSAEELVFLNPDDRNGIRIN